MDETFTTAPRGWPNDPQGTAWYADGAYRLEPRVAGQFVVLDAPLTDVVKDVVVSARFRKTGGPSGGGYGLVVADQGPDPHDGVNQGGRFVALEAGDEGTVGAWQREEDQWVDLQPWTPSAAVHEGSAVNELMVRVQGQQLTLLVNGTQVAQVTTKLAAGRVGVFVGGDGNQVALERFTVQSTASTSPSSTQPQATATLVVTLAPTETTTTSAGPVRHIRTPDDNPLLVMAPNVDDLERLALAVTHDDKDGITQLFASGRVVDWQAQGGKRVVVLGHVVRTNSSSSLVRILDGPQAGESGWIFDPELGP